MRLGVADDLEAIAELERLSFGSDAWSSEAVGSELAAGRMLVATQEGALVGYAASLAAGDVVDLTRIVVTPERRRAGLGRELLKCVVRDARGANRMLLEVSAANEAALAFYATEGFVEIDRRRRYYRDGSDAVVLRLPLGPACGGG